LIALCTKPISVHSDNGINFVGAENELNSLLQEMPKDPSFQRFNKEKNIDFNIPELRIW
jgi:hypothetical protein